jgi:hypothetical protein
MLQAESTTEHQKVSLTRYEERKGVGRSSTTHFTTIIEQDSICNPLNKPWNENLTPPKTTLLPAN